MNVQKSLSNKIFDTFNIILLLLFSAAAIFPFIHLLAVSLSSNAEAMSGEVNLWPKGLTYEAYTFLITNVEFFTALKVSIMRVVLGTGSQLIVSILAGYALSKEEKHFRQRTVYAWFLALLIFVQSGLIPFFFVVKMTHLTDNILALVIPFASSSWLIILLLNFFRSIPKEMEEAAIVDGAGQWRILWSVFLPVSKPAIATILLLSIIMHWNEFFFGILFMNSSKKYPLATYISNMVTASQINQFKPGESMDKLRSIGLINLRSAQIFLGALPILMVYPFLQRYFIKGLVVGSVKG